jgi:hypothetical protein
MKTKKDFDPMFHAERRRGSRRIGRIGALTIVAAMSGMGLRAGPIPPRRVGPSSVRIAPMPTGSRAFQGPARSPEGGVMPSRDPFMIVAPADLDPRMVVRAREDLDVEMVVNPETWRRGSMVTEPAPAVVRYSPRPVPAPAPVDPRHRR